MRTAFLLLAAWLLAGGDGQAQVQVPSWLTLDSVAAVDRTSDGTAPAPTGVILDAFASAQLGNGFEVYARPFVQRLGTGEWNRQIWLAAARFEHKGPVGFRVDAGLIPSPIGLANLTIRPHINPTISQPASLFQGLPAPEPFSPRLTLLGAIYPYGVTAPVSGLKWDARVAIIDTSPMRSRRVFASVKAPRFANVVVGGGVTPIVGLRVGASVTQGGWKRADERPLSADTLDATVISVETEYSFRFTKLAGEWTRDALDTTTGRSVAIGWYVQAQHAISPRWFAAGRLERIGAPESDPLVTAPVSAFLGVEETVGYRLTPEVTFRLSHRARRAFAQDPFDNQMFGSVVWARRWF
jgi:hypothetical protein